MKADAVSFMGHRCFKTEWAGFDAIKPVNVIIGRNNSGKSNLLDLVEAACKSDFVTRNWKTRFHGTLDEESLEHVFHRHTRGGDLQGDHWSQHGCHFIGASLFWVQDGNGNVLDLTFDAGFSYGSPYGLASTNARLWKIREMLKPVKHSLAGSQFRRLLADRDIRTELPSTEFRLLPDGAGATNIIRRYIVTSDPKYPREIVQRHLLDALNVIFGSDGQFTEIQVKLHDNSSITSHEGSWEVYLGEDGKGLVPLSNSGSGLKTILLVLLNLLVIPKIEGKQKSQYTYAFEELENNLHPALLRRLLMFLEEFAVREKCTIFLTTHSSTALDLFGVSPHAQITHVIHDGEAARTRTVSGHLDKLAIVSSLGAKPSDLLQSNGIIWVEGPSDRIYLNRWIEIFGDGQWKEGRDYQCAFYGGALLAHAQVQPEELAVDDLVNLFNLNSNFTIVCDSDRTSRTGKGAQLKPRTCRIREEVGGIPTAFCWITEPKEIEHYLPGAVLSAVYVRPNLPDPQPYEPFFPVAKKKSYLETVLERKTVDKVELALKAIPHMTKDEMAKRFDLAEKMAELLNVIARWNSPSRRG